MIDSGMLHSQPALHTLDETIQDDNRAIDALPNRTVLPFPPFLPGLFDVV